MRCARITGLSLVNQVQETNSHPPVPSVIQYTPSSLASLLFAADLHVAVSLHQVTRAFPGVYTN